METDLDETDRRLLRRLNENARRTDADLADELDMTEAEVAERIERFRDEGVITRFTAMINPEKVGYISVAFGFSSEPGKTDEIARRLRSEQNVYKVWLLSGRHNLIAHASFEGIHEFQQFNHEVLNEIDGINEYETSIATKTVLDDGSVLLGEE